MRQNSARAWALVVVLGIVGFLVLVAVYLPQLWRMM